MITYSLARLVADIYEYADLLKSISKGHLFGSFPITAFTGVSNSQSYMHV
jgi:hypothetical protein